jgi:hypothetical protein
VNSSGCAFCIARQDGEPRLVSHTHDPEQPASVHRCGSCGSLWVSDRGAPLRRVDLVTARDHLPWLGEDDGTGRFVSRYLFEHGDRTVVLRAEESLNPMIAALFRLLGSLDPARLEPGFTIDAGWTPLRLADRDGELVLETPDVPADPGAWTTDISTALRVSHDQSTTCGLFSQAHTPVRAGAKVVLDRDVLSRGRLYLHRSTEPTDTDSGWFAGREDRTDADNEHLVACAAGDLLRTRPALVRDLALPAGTLLVVEGDELVFGSDAHDTPFFPAAAGR